MLRAPGLINHGKGLVELDNGPLSIDRSEVRSALLGLFRAANYRPPVLPSVAVELLQMSRKTNVETQEIVALLGREPLLAAQMLKIAQSALYSRGAPVRSLEEAILRLGLKRVSDFFFQASLEMKVFRAPAYDEPMERLRKHAAFSAELARLICRESIGMEESAFLCGLLHDVGAAACILVLATLRGPDGKAIPFVEAKRAILELHEGAAEFIAKAWQLPPDLCIVLGLHHRVQVDGRIHPLAAAVSVADSMAHELGFGFIEETSVKVTTQLADALDLRPSQLASLRKRGAALAESFRG